MKTLSSYLESIENLHANKQKGVIAPHKAILLLAVIDLIEQGDISSTEIFLTDELQDKFNFLWKYYLGKSPVFSPDVFKPYYHMNHESFWELVPVDGNYDSTEEPRYNKTWIRSKFKYALLDQDLFKYLQDDCARSRMRLTLIGTYLVNQPIEQRASLFSNKFILDKICSWLMLFVA